MAAPRNYDDENRARAVRMVQDRVREHKDSQVGACRHVGELLGINPAMLRNWVEKDEVDAGQRPGTPTEVSQELAALRRENAELKRACEILKTASAFFAAAEPERRFTSSMASIDEDKHRFGVEPICRLLSQHGVTIAPSTDDARRAQPATTAELQDAYAAYALIDLHRDNRSVYGARTCWHALRRARRHLGRDQVARLMPIAGIDGISRGKHHTSITQRDEKAPRHPDLVDLQWSAPWTTRSWNP